MVNNDNKIQYLLFFLFLILIISIGIFLVFYYISLFHNDIDQLKKFSDEIKKSISENDTSKYLTNFEINKFVENSLKFNNNNVYEFYDSYTEDRDITYMIIQYSLLNEVPINLAFSIAAIESQFDLNAKGINTNSYDIGLFQLNNTSFPNYTEKELFNLETNIKLATETLRSNYNRSGSWVWSIINYNIGFKINENGINYYIKIDEYEKLITKEFNIIF
jgi:hypothetical protein